MMNKKQTRNALAMMPIHALRAVTFVLLLSVCPTAGLLAQGYQSPYVIWPVPGGQGRDLDDAPLGYSFPSNASSRSTSLDDSEIWETIDMNGDGLPDLVVTGGCATGSPAVLGYGAMLHWRVHLNTGSSFDSVGIQWQVPQGGRWGRGFFYVQAESDPNVQFVGDQVWDLKDLDGDARPDLVVTGEQEGPSGLHKCFGATTHPHWRMYRNLGDRFDSLATQWQLPESENATLSGTLGYSYTVGAGGSVIVQKWAMLDMDGDDLEDLVVTSQSPTPNASALPFGGEPDPHWKVFHNNGTGFDTVGVLVVIPRGGARTPSGVRFGFDWISGDAYDMGANSESWAMRDMNGDGRLDLVVTAIQIVSNTTYPEVPGIQATPHWRVYLNNGVGFDLTPVVWAVPAGGLRINGAYHGFHALQGGRPHTVDAASLIWDVVDMDGNGLPDLVVSGEKDFAMQSFSPDNFPHWKVYWNTGTGFAAQPYAFPIPGGGIGFWGTAAPVDVLGFPITDSRRLGQSSFHELGWKLLDMNGDAQLDFIATGIENDHGPMVWGHGDLPHWRVFWGTSSAVSAPEMQAAPLDMMLYPNPADDVVHLSADGSNLSWRVMDMQGRLSAQGALVRGATLDLDVHDWARGVYLLEVVHASGRLCRKLVLQ